LGSTVKKTKTKEALLGAKFAFMSISLYEFDIVDIAMSAMLIRCWVNIVYIVIVPSMSTLSTLSTLQCWHDVELASSRSLLLLLCQYRQHCQHRDVNNVDTMLIRDLTTLQCQRCKQEERFTINTQCWLDIVKNCDVDDVNDVNKKKGSQCRQDVDSISHNIA
jgi:hypothetical protein